MKKATCESKSLFLMISVPAETDDIPNGMISATQVIYADSYEGTDIISYFTEIYHAAQPYIMLHLQYIIFTILRLRNKIPNQYTKRC